VPWLAKPAVIDLVAEAVETASAQGRTAEHPWARGIAALEDCGHPAVPLLLRARAEEGSGRPDQARQLIGSCLRLDPALVPAMRDLNSMFLDEGFGTLDQASGFTSKVNRPPPSAVQMPRPGRMDGDRRHGHHRPGGQR